MHLGLLGLVFFLSLTIIATPRAQSINSFTDWLMPKVLAKMAENERMKREFIRYDKIRIIHDLNQKPASIKSTEKFEIYGINGLSYEKLVLKNKVPQKNQRPKVGTFDLNEILAQRYIYTTQTPSEQYRDGRWYFVVDFKPKPADQLPWDSLEDQGINRLMGSLWIDIETLATIRMEGKIPQQFRGRKGLIFNYSVYRFELTMEQGIFSKIVVPKKVEFIMHFDSWAIPETNEMHTYTYENHRDVRIEPPR